MNFAALKLLFGAAIGVALAKSAGFSAEGVLAGFKAGYDVLVLIVAIVGGTFVGEALTLHNIAKTGKAMKSWIGWPADSRRRDR